MEIPAPVVSALIAGAFAVVATIVTQRMARRAQKDVANQDRLEWAIARLDRVEARERLRDDYIHQLRDHISTGKPPPPPPWPDGLTDIT